MDLRELLELQYILQRESFGYRLEEFSEDEFIEYVRNNALALHTELSEFLQELPWKWYGKDLHFPVKRPHGEFRTHVIEELVDCLHFLLNLFLALGVDAHELESAYRGKRAVNEERQAAL